MGKTKEERLALQRLCKRRKYIEIKNDPELYALEKEKQRQKYKKRKEEKKQKSITEKSPREQKKLRKKWRENSKQYRQRKKDKASSAFTNVEVVDIETEGIPKETTKSTEDPIGLFTKGDVKKAERKIRYEELKKRIKLTKIIKNQQKIIQNLKMKVKRLKSDINNKSKDHTEGNRQEVNQYKKRVNTRLAISKLKSRKDTKFRLLRQQVIETIEKFYNDDAVSTISAGKKEFITRNKRRMQKRYLSAPLKILHKKFLSETDIKISYSFFTKHRPFWVLHPKPIRETCLCAQHTNMELIIKALYNASIIDEKNSNELVSQICCELRSDKCLLRECILCKNKVLNYKEFSNASSITYFKWRKINKEVMKKGIKKKQVLTIKDSIVTQPLSAIQELETMMNPFLLHVHNIEAQYTAMKKLKENLTVSEAVIHVDFSENYALKYADEVQAFHFGGSRQQVSIHTSVVYTHDFSTGAIRPTSVCTLSSCVRHDAPAIWSHLIPLITQALEINPFITILHFLSDSPISQYRNKFMFYIISRIRNDEYISRITWNYTEAGHGKGALDGVGAVLKRTADKMVHYGRDVGDFGSFCQVLKENVENIIIKIVTEDSIKERETLLPKNLKPFRGTLSVHQVLWDVLSTKLTLRKVSCFICDIDECCMHGKHLGFYEIIHDNKNNRYKKENHNDSENVYMLAATAPKKSICENKRIKVLSDITINNDLLLHHLNQPSTSKATFFK